VAGGFGAAAAAVHGAPATGAAVGVLPPVPADRLDRLTPDTWTLDQALLDRPGNKEVQLQLFYDYQFNLDAYRAFQDYFRSHRPPTLIAWGKHDEIFGADGARAYLRDLPDAELHLLDAGHFALETHGDEIAALVRDFLDCVVDRAFTRESEAAPNTLPR
jgi:pimeloyl-ACP methyl ester carboxylesterase